MSITRPEIDFPGGEPPKNLEITDVWEGEGPVAKAGDTVARGQVIGEVGMTGRATGPHLHWAMNWFQVKLDPSRSTRTPAPPKS